MSFLWSALFTMFVLCIWSIDLNGSSDPCFMPSLVLDYWVSFAFISFIFVHFSIIFPSVRRLVHVLHFCCDSHWYNPGVEDLNNVTFFFLKCACFFWHNTSINTAKVCYFQAPRWWMSFTTTLSTQCLNS